MIDGSLHHNGGRAAVRWATRSLAVLLIAACGGRDAGPLPLTAEVPLTLEDHLEVAAIKGSEVPANLAEPIEWRFDEPQPDWQPLAMMNPNTKPVKVERTQDALLLLLDESNRDRNGAVVGAISVDVPEWSSSEWDHIRVRARSTTGIMALTLAFNTAPGEPSESRGANPFATFAGGANTINDGVVHSYVLQAHAASGPREERWHRIGLGIYARDPGTVEVLSVTAVPKEAVYADAAVGTRADMREPRYGRRAIYTHTPTRLEYRVEIPEAARFVTGLGVVGSDTSVSFTVRVEDDGAEPTTVLEETHADMTVLAQRSVDLSAFAGRTVTLVLETDAEHRGTVALWGAPTLADASRTHDANGGLIGLPAYRFVTSDGGVNDWTVAFSPDAETLLFSRTSFETGHSELFFVPVAGGVPRRFPASPLPVEASRMSWSTQTGRIAFTGFSADGRIGIWLVDPDGSNLRAFSSADLSDQVFYPSWYPDGHRLAVVDYGGGDGGGRGGVVKRIDTRDGAVEALTDRADVLAGMPSVSPDGMSIAFAGQPNTGRYVQSDNRIWLLDDEGLRELDPQQGRTPAWSPDGEWVVFESNRGSPNGHYALFAVPRQGGQALQLTSYEMHVNHPSWSPNGKQIAFSAALNLSDPWRIALLDFPGK